MKKNMLISTTYTRTHYGIKMRTNFSIRKTDWTFALLIPPLAINMLSDYFVLYYVICNYMLKWHN